MEIQISGPKVYFELPFDLPDSTIFTMKNLITQTTITLFAVTIILIIAAILLTRKITKRPGPVQVGLEKIVTMLYNLVEDTMGKHNARFAPYIGTLFASSIFGSVIGMTQIFRSSTADLSVTLAWALVTSGIVWAQNIKHQGLIPWLKGFTEPIFIMTPMNLISEVASPMALAFRHFGNVAGGGVLTTLIYAALALLSNAILGWIPGVIGEIPFFQAGLPALLSIYFDLFSGFVQALVFSLLTMVYIAGACPPPEEWPENRRKKLEKMEAKRLAKENK